MMSRRIPLCLSLVICLGLSPIAKGQETDKRSESHISISFDGKSWKGLQDRFQSLENAEQENLLNNLKDNLRRISNNRNDLEAWKNLSQLSNSPSLKALGEKLTNNGENRKKLNELMQNQSFKDLVQELRENKVDNKRLKELTKTQPIQELLQELKSSQAGLTGNKSQSVGDATGLEKPSNQTKGGDGPVNMPQAGGGNSDSDNSIQGQESNDGLSINRHSNNPTPGESSLPPPERPTREQAVRRWLADNLNPNRGPLAQSPAIQDAIRELRRTSFTAEPPAADDNSLAAQVARWGESLTKSEAWSKVDWSSLGKWTQSNSGLPKIESPVGIPSLGVAPNVTIPSATVIDRGLQILWVVVIVVAGILVWKLLGGSIPGVGQASRRGWRIGPWPVRPGAVSSRQEIIQAFEYLSFLRLGPKAKSQNHLDLAAHLGQSTSQHRQSAIRLAAVYEQARYTPVDEPLSADALAAARNELTFLAGVKA
jgi:hypothetical protein